METRRKELFDRKKKKKKDSNRVLGTGEKKRNKLKIYT